MGVDGPENRGMKVGPKAVGAPIVDVHEEIIFPPLNSGHLLRFEMGDLVLLAEGPKAVDPRRIGAVGFAADHGDFHTCGFHSTIPVPDQ
jgi:hypothetical protein